MVIGQDVTTAAQNHPAAQAARRCVFGVAVKKAQPRIGPEFVFAGVLARADTDNGERSPFCSQAETSVGRVIEKRCRGF